MAIKSQKTGFTLIEILTVIAVIAVVVATAVQIFSFSLRSEARTRSILALKQTGDNALAVMANNIRNSRTIDLTDCSSSPVGHDSITLVNQDYSSTIITCSETGIVVDDGIPETEPQNLVGSDYFLSGHDSCFRCYSTETDGLKSVSINFTLARISSDPSKQYSLEFNSTAFMRQY